MIYVLILLIGSSQSYKAVSTVTQEFNTAQACLIATDELRRQVSASGMDYKVLAASCLPKGEKK